MVSDGQHASLEKLRRDLRRFRREAQLRQADIYREPSSVGRVESGKIPLSVLWLERYEQALDRDDLVDRFREILEAPATGTYAPNDERDDFVARTRLLESRVFVELGETVTVRDRRTMAPLHPPLAGMRLRNRVPRVGGKRPKLLDRHAVGADVIGHFWLHDEILVVDVAFNPPIARVAPPYTWDMVYEYDRLAHMMYEVVGTRSEYFEVEVHFPSSAFEVVSCAGLPEDIAAAEVRAFSQGRPHRLQSKSLNQQNKVKVPYRDLRPAFLYGVFWRKVPGRASS